MERGLGSVCCRGVTFTIDYYYALYARYNIECNKKEKSARNSTLIPGKNVSRDLGAPFIYTFIHIYTHISFLNKKEAELIGIFHPHTHTHSTSVRLFLPGRCVIQRST
jgi:hypothetical protein